MELEKTPISNLTKFRKHFTLKEVIMNLQQFVRDFSPEHIFYEDQKDKEIYCFISYCERWRQAVGEEGSFFLLQHVDEKPAISWKEQAEDGNCADSAPDHVIGLNFQDMEELQKLEQLKGEAASLVFPVEMAALCELAHCSLRCGELEEYYSPSKPKYADKLEMSGHSENPVVPSIGGEVFETEQGIIISPAVERFSLRQWKPSEDEKGQPVRTKRLIRESYSSYSGCTELNLVDAEGRHIPGWSRSLEYEQYANFIGDSLVEFLPSENRCGAYRIYKTWDKNGKALLERDKNDTKQNTYQDTTGELGRMSCFAVAEDGGFVGIADGRLLGYTSMVNLPDMTEEIPVSICSKNGLFAILTDQGNVVSNFAFAGHGICMICMDEYGYLYALGRDGKVVTNYPHSAPIVSRENILWIGFDSSGKKLILRDECYEETRIDIL